MKKADCFYIPNELSIQRLQNREGPPISFVVWAKNSSRAFDTKADALRHIKWPKSTPTGVLIREWFDQFDEEGELPELDMQRIQNEGFGPESFAEEPNDNTKTII